MVNNIVTEEQKKKKRAQMRAWRKANPEKVRAGQNTWRRANPEKHRASQRAWREANPEKHRARARAYYEKHLEKRRVYNLHTLYGLSPEQFDVLIVKQNGRCAICGDSFVKTPHIDHDHTTNLVRGLLCSPCNIALGLFKDDTRRLVTAARYVEGLIAA